MFAIHKYNTMKFKIIFTCAILFAFMSNAQVGINTSTPSSTLEVNGSFEGAYTSISGNYTLTNKDYQVSFTGTSNSVLTFPAKSTADNSVNDFRGRKYYIKNNSASSTLTFTTASGDFLRFGGGKADANTYALKAGTYASVTANGTTGWDVDIVGNTGNNNWILNTTGLNGFTNTLQNIPTGNSFTTINNCSVTVTVPAGPSQSQTILNFTGWGEAAASNSATGSFRFQIVQTGTVAATYQSAMMTSWAMTSAGIARFSFPVAIAALNLAPGTYTFTLQTRREDEAGAAPTSMRIWGVQSKVDVFIKE